MTNTTPTRAAQVDSASARISKENLDALRKALGPVLFNKVFTAEQIERVQEGVQRRIDAMWEEGGIEAVDRRKVHMVVRGGRAFQEIVEAAKVREIDLIVMGASQEGGTTAERVVRDAPCSVYCVRSDS